MKNKKPLIIIVSAAFTVPTQAASIIHSAGNINSITAPSVTSEKNTNWVAGTTGQATIGGSYTMASGVTGSMGGQDFTYDIVVTAEAIGNVGSTGFQFDSNGHISFSTNTIARLSGTASGAEFGDGAGIIRNFRPGDSWSISITNLSNAANVQFDGFINFSMRDFLDAGETVTFNGTSYIQGTPVYTDSDVSNGVFTTSTANTPVQPGGKATFAYTNGANASMQAIAFQFSTVPEPTTTSLLGLGALAVLNRRRRA